ncbi:putative secreted protein [Rhodovulum iodosum]|uniref:Secreted protein n=1 Tax=Rhodovulum iodosum TaxID=68291 RepID=A0ABV3XQF0_9RHOB|nr:DUF1467 family protein [Rhodovulum robiginosum]RSK33013.1 DUF1467 family protein [Rhodovulum robiginosum]
MGITSAIVLFAVIWFMVLFIVLPIRLTTQGEAGKVEPGTPESAPAAPNLKRKVRIVTLIAVLIWAGVAGVILSGAVTVRDIDIFNRMDPPPADGRGG